MKILLFLSLLFPLVLVQQSPANDGSAVSVLSYKWSRARRLMEKPESGEGITPPASAMIPANKNFARNVRANEPMGVRDPNADTLDGRSAQIEKNVQEARSPHVKQLDGFAYRVKVQNTGTSVIEVLFWEYQFVDSLNTTNVTRHQFLCGVSLRPGKDKELEGFSISSPSNVIDVDSLAKKNTNPFQETILINRVEYSDGAIWQRQGWNLKDVKATYERALKEPWVPGMCKSL
jgi:hypothetical protein